MISRVKLAFIASLFMTIGMGFQAMAGSLSVQNSTANEMRVHELYHFENGRIQFVVSSEDPIYIKSGESVRIPEVGMWQHHYILCASGICLQSSLNMCENIDYVVNAYFLEGTNWLTGEAIPNHWQYCRDSDTANLGSALTTPHYNQWILDPHQRQDERE